MREFRTSIHEHILWKFLRVKHWHGDHGILPVLLICCIHEVGEEICHVI